MPFSVRPDKTANRGEICQRSEDLNALVLVLGVPTWPAEVPLGDGSLPELTGFLAEIAVALPSALLTHRPDIEAAERQLMAANANIGAAHAAFFLRIELTGPFGRASASLSNLFDNATRAWSFTPQNALLQIRTAVLNDQLRSHVERWYPSIAREKDQRLAA